MKIFKRLIQIAIFLTIIIGLALAAVALLVDPNEYKPQITQLVKDSTGRDLHMGDIDVSVFPWIGLRLEDIAVSNRVGFAGETFAQIETIDVKVALLPLLSLKTEVGVVRLNGLTVDLQKQADGSSNWDDLMGQAVTDTTPAKDISPVEESTNTELPPIAIRVGGVEITDANIRYQDKASNVDTYLKDFNVVTGEIVLGQPIDFDMNFNIAHSEPAMTVDFDLTGIIENNLDAQLFGLSNMQLSLKVSGSDIPQQTQTIVLTSDISTDLNKQTAAIKNLTLNVMGLDIQGDINASQILAEPAVQGALNINIPQLPQLMQTLEIELPEMADATVLQSMRVELPFSATTTSARIKNLKIAFDDTQVTGDLEVIDFETQASKIKLAIDQINADRYLPPDAEVVEEETVTSSDNQSKNSSSEKIELPIELIKTLDVQGDFSIGALQVMNLKTQNIQAGVTAKAGKVLLKPIKIDLYQGHFQGDASLDVTRKRPYYETHLDLRNVDAGPLLTDYMEDSLLDGKANATAYLTTNGSHVKNFMKRLNGKFSFEFLDGALSMDMRKKLREAKAKLKREEYDPAADIGEPTKFSSIRASSKIKDGTVKNKDLEVKARQFLVTGAGEYKLPKDIIDYKLDVTYAKGSATQEKDLDDLDGLTIPFHLKGELAKLDYFDIFIKGLFKASASRDTEAAKKKAEQKKAEAKKKLEAEKAKAKKELKKKKKKAKEKAKKKLEEKKKKEKEKAKKKLLEKLGL